MQVFYGFIRQFTLGIYIFPSLLIGIFSLSIMQPYQLPQVISKAELVQPQADESRILCTQRVDKSEKIALQQCLKHFAINETAFNDLIHDKQFNEEYVQSVREEAIRVGTKKLSAQEKKYIRLIEECASYWLNKFGYSKAIVIPVRSNDTTFSAIGTREYPYILVGLSCTKSSKKTIDFSLLHEIQHLIHNDCLRDSAFCCLLSKYYKNKSFEKANVYTRWHRCLERRADIKAALVSKEVAQAGINRFTMLRDSGELIEDVDHPPVQERIDYLVKLMHQI